MDGNTSNIGIVEPKSSTKMNIGTIFLAVIAIAGVICAAVFAVLYFKKPTILKNDNNNPNIVSPSADETDITDESAKNSLKQLIGEMLSTDNKDGAFVINSTDYPDIELFQSGFLSVYDSINVAIKSIPESNFSTLTEDLAPSVTSTLNSMGYTDFDTASIKTVNGDIVANQYKKIFNLDLDESLVVNGDYIYMPEADIFFNNPEVILGESKDYRYYYISKITEDEEHAYVYMSGAQYDKEKGIVYCTVYNPYIEYIANISLCENTEDGDFALNEKNYKNFAISRLEFEKAEDGSYYLTGALPARL